MKKAFRLVAYLSFLASAVLILLECCYRYQVIDFYKGPLTSLNSPEEIQSKRPDMLIIGDSFSAQPNSYVDHLRQAAPQLSIVNASVPGTGIRQHQLILEKRLTEYAPKRVLYQLYVGNDLTDIQHPINFSTNFFLRNIYWMVGEWFLVVPYMNSRLGSLKSHPTIDHSTAVDSFSVNKYTQRCMHYLNADPYIVNNCIHLEGDYAQVHKELVKRLQLFIESLGDEIELTVLVIPHCVQVSKLYEERFRELGAKFNGDMQSNQVAFIRNLEKAFPELEFINPMEDLRAVNAPYFANDPHLSVKGQEAVCTSVTKSRLFRNLGADN